MKIIINAEPDEFPYVLELIEEARPRFERQPSRPGWGWVFSKPGKRGFFIREIKDGLSASPAKPPRLSASQ